MWYMFLFCFFFFFEGVALLPFVDERRLRAALADVYPDLTPEEGEQKPLSVYVCNELHLSTETPFLTGGD